MKAKYCLQCNLGDGWSTASGMEKDELGNESLHIEASACDGSFVDISFGVMPDGDTARDQAFACYVDMVGFSSDDPEGFDPLAKIKFNGRPAWGFDAYCEDDTPMRLLAQEMRTGSLAVIVFGAPDRDRLVALHLKLERSLRIHASQD